MAMFDFAGKAIHLKVVYYGCALSGKTTNLVSLHRLTDPQGRQGLVSIATKNDRTLFFDLLPLDLGQLAGLSVRVKVYTVPGQVHYELTRRKVLADADAVVLVIDSAPDMSEPNAWAVENLRHNLKQLSMDPEEVPLVLQWNKRDLEKAVPVDRLAARFNPGGLPAVESVATTGVGVVETFSIATKRAIQAAHRKAGKSPPSDDELNQMVGTALQVSELPAVGEAASDSPAFEHRFDEEAYRDAWAEKGRDRQIVDQETLLEEAVQTGMELAERLDGLGAAQETNDRRQNMLQALGQLSGALSDPRSPPLPVELMQTLLGACSRTHGSLLLLKPDGKSLDEHEVVPAGRDPLNAAVASVGSAAFRLSQGDGSRLVEDLQAEVFFGTTPPEAQGLTSCFINPVVCDGIRFGAVLVYNVIDQRRFEPAEKAYWVTAAALLGLSLHWRGLRAKVNVAAKV